MEEEVLKLALYETMVVVKPGVEKEALDNLMDNILNSLKEQGINPIKVMDIGVRDLAYKIAREKKGRYFIIYYESDGKVIDSFQRHLKLLDDVIRFLTVRTVGVVPEDDFKIPDLDKGVVLRRTRGPREYGRTRETFERESENSVEERNQ